MTAQEWLYQLLDIMVQKEASDLLISVNAPPTLKMAGQLTPLGDQGLSVAQVTELVGASVPEALLDRFRIEHEANFALSLKGKGRFRVSAFRQRGQAGMVVRRIDKLIRSDIDESWKRYYVERRVALQKTASRSTTVRLSLLD